MSTYNPPAPLSVVDASDGRLMGTMGGDTFFVSGSSFGPSLYGSIQGAVRVTYGPMGQEDKYVATVVSMDQDVIEVLTAEGSGGPHLWRVEVAGQVGDIIGDPATDGTSYRPPAPTDLTMFVASSDGGPDELRTSGSQVVVISGSEFGPDDALATVHFGLNSRAASWANQTLERTILLAFTNCQHDPRTPHTALICSTPAGSGSGYFLRVSVDGQSASLAEPVSGLPFGYAKPVVTAVGGAGSVDANTEGGQVIRIDGVSFGPA